MLNFKLKSSLVQILPPVKSTSIKKPVQNRVKSKNFTTDMSLISYVLKKNCKKI